MITYSAAGYWIDAVSGPTPKTTGRGEYFPDMEEARSAAMRNHLQSFWSAIVCAPLDAARLAARIMPTSMNTALTARTEARALARNIKRLEELAPHLLNDIGIEQVSAGVYAVIDAVKPTVEAQSPELTVAAPVARPVKAAPQRAWGASARWPAAEFAGVALP